MAKAVKIDYSALNEDILGLKDKVKAGLTVSDAGVASQENDKVFLENLPSGVTADDVKKVDAARERYYAASAAALGELALPAFQGNKNLKTVSYTHLAGHGHKVVQTYNREESGTNSLTGKEYHKHGVLHQRVTITGAKTNNGLLGKVREAVGNAAAAALG